MGATRILTWSVPATVLNFLFAPGRSSVTLLPCWLTSLTAPRTTRRRPLPQSLTPSLPHLALFFSNKFTSFDSNSCFCLLPPCCPQAEAQVSAGLGLYPQCFPGIL